MTTTEMDLLPSYDELVAAEVRAMVARKRLSQGRIALALGVHQTYVSRRMTGMQPFSVDELAAIAKLLDCDPRDFLPAPGEYRYCINSISLTFEPAA